MASVMLLSPFNSNFAIKETAILTWTTPKLAETDDTSSPTFSLPSNRNRFQLRLKAKDSLFNLHHIFVELHHNGFEKELLFLYRVSILDTKGEKHYTREYMWNYRALDYKYCKYNATNYIEAEKCSQFMVNGSLMIYCEVDILDTKLDRLPPKQQIDSLGKLSQNYETLLESGKLSDFIVLIGDKQYRVHKAILAAQSAVFAAMFEHDQTQEMKEGRVKIEEVAVEVFDLLVRYIYTGKIESVDEYAAELFVAADRYQLDHLKSVCEQSLISTLTTESVSSVLLLADMHNAQQLKLKCTEYIVGNIKEVMQTEAWKQLIKTNRIDLVAELLLASAATKIS